MYARRPRYRLLILLLVALLAFGGTAGIVIAKYVTQHKVTGTVTFQAELADSIEVLEHKVERNPAGDYELQKETTNEVQTYTVMPGVDIPKDPYVVITEKTPIEAYLFVEIVKSEGWDDAIRYQLAKKWKELKDGDTTVTGKKGGTVYVYEDVIDENTTADPIYILKENKIFVDQGLNHNTSGISLTVYASLAEIIPDKSKAEIYNTLSD